MMVSLLHADILTPLIFGSITCIFAVMFWYITLNQYVLFSDVTHYPQRDIGDTTESEPVVLTGTVSPDSQTHESPFAKEESVFTSWEINQPPQRGNASRGRCLYRGIQSTPFIIQDESGCLAVDFDSISQPPNPRAIENVMFDAGVRVSDTIAGIGEQEQVIQKAASNEPEHIRQFIDQFDDSHMLKSDGDTQHQCNEQTLSAGEDIVIIGHIKFDADNTPYITQIQDGASIVYQGTYDSLIANLKKNYVVPLILAVLTTLTTVYSAWLIYMAWG